MKGLVIIPFIDCLDMTGNAIADAVGQLDGTVDVLLIDQGSGAEVRAFAERTVQLDTRTRLWQHRPPMPSLAATWNRALDYAWDAGYSDAMVWNNDIRVHKDMYARLRDVAAHHKLWFTTPVNVAQSGDPEQWQLLPDMHVLAAAAGPTLGGPDFSCFLIHRECHAKYRFDERFQPAYHEDGDYHRRMWLGGDGVRIAGVTLPYLHFGSATIKRSDEAQVAFAPQFAACRARYVAKWGGEPHHETKVVPMAESAIGLLHFDNVGTPGGYLSGGYPNFDPQQPCFNCAAVGFARRIGIRASGDKFFGCAFCTGYENNEQDGGSLG